MVHSNEGDFRQSQVIINGKVQFIPRLANGGHGQKCLDLLDKYGIKYNILKTYSNGVRVGNVPNHYKREKQDGSNQSWFPKNWTERDIRRVGEHVSGLKRNRYVADGKHIYGVFNVVIRTRGKIATIFLDSEQTDILRKNKK